MGGAEASAVWEVEAAAGSLLCEDTDRATVQCNDTPKDTLDEGKRHLG